VAELLGQVPLTLVVAVVLVLMVLQLVQVVLVLLLFVMQIHIQQQREPLARQHIL
jgi:hypothetical protein